MNYNRSQLKLSHLLSALVVVILYFGLRPATTLYAAEPNCSAAYYIDETLPNGARWDMCWEHRNNDGIVFSQVHFTPPGGVRTQILAEASISQVHVPYDDNGARYHDITDYGFGGEYMVDLDGGSCPSGSLLQHSGKNVICKELGQRGYAFNGGSQQEQGHELALFSVSKVGAYNYIPYWRFLDDGTIEPVMGATGRLQRTGSNQLYGWPIRRGTTTGISHIHNYYWRLDFDLGDTRTDEVVKEVNLVPDDGNRQRNLSISTFTTEQARSIDPAQMRSWIIQDTTLTNQDGQPISYELVPTYTGHRDEGPSNEPWTLNDFYVTRYNACERYVSHNPTSNGCTADVSQFVNGESLNNQDLVIYYGITFHHIPRDEDEPNMHAHWDSFRLVPRDVSNTNPLVSYTGSAPDVTDPGDQQTRIDEAVSLQIEATDIDGDSLTFSAVGLPAGLSINEGTGLIRGNPTELGSFSIDIQVSDGNVVSTTNFEWLVYADVDRDGIPDVNDNDLDNDGITNEAEVPLQSFDTTSPILTMPVEGASSTGTVDLSAQGARIGQTVQIINLFGDGDLNGSTETFSLNFNNGEAIVSGANTGIQCDGSLRPARSPIDLSVTVIDIGGGIPGLSIEGTATTAVNDLSNCANVRYRFDIRGDGSGEADTDGDGVENRFDLDSDNDGILDVVEAGGPDADGNGFIDNIAVNQGTISSPPDRDNDSLPDFLDLTSDGTNFDIDLAGLGNLDTNNDGTLSGNDSQGGIDSDGDGIDRLVDGAPDTPGSSPNSNTAPTLTNPGDQTGQVGAPVSLSLNGDDADGDPLVYSATGLPTGLTLDSSSGLISGTPTAEGGYSVTVEVDDGRSGVDSQSFSWTIGAAPQPNGAPTLDDPGNQTNLQDDVVTLQLAARDPDNDPLQFSATGLPTGLTLDANSGLISGTAVTIGTFNVTLSVSDGQGGTDSVSLTWIVSEVTPPPNESPTLTNPGNRTNTVGEAVSLSLSASDPDGDSLVFTADVLPSGLTLDGATGLIRGTPDTAGDTSVTVTVSDGRGGTDSVSFVWTIEEVAPPSGGPALTVYGDQLAANWSIGSWGASDLNQSVSSPVFAGSNALGVTLGGSWATVFIETSETLPVEDYKAVRFAIYGTDPAQSINFKLMNGAYQQSNNVTVTPVNGQWTTVEIPMADFGLSGNIQYLLISNPFSNSQPILYFDEIQLMINDGVSINRPPSLNNPGAQSDVQGESVSLQLSASDPDGDSLTYGATGLPSGVTINSTSGQISGVADTAGSYTVNATVDDGNGGSDSVSFRWTISEPPPPVNGSADLIFGDQFASGWRSGSWGAATIDPAVTAPVFDGSRSLGIEYQEAWSTVYIKHDVALPAVDYTAITFHVYGTAPGQQLDVKVMNSSYQTSGSVRITPTQGVWTSHTVTLSSLQADSDIFYVLLSNPNDAGQPVFYVDDLKLLKVGN